jgi:hypothetical protein
MARSLSTRLTTEIGYTVTRPFFLVQITWSGSTSRLSTGGTVTYASQTWQGGTATVEALRTLPGGALEGQLSIGNTDNAIGALALANNLSSCAVVISVLYGTGPWTTGDAEQVFAGVLDGCQITPTRVTFGIVSTGRRREHSPRIYCAPPLCNHLPPAGTKIAWAGEVYELQGAA